MGRCRCGNTTIIKYGCGCGCNNGGGNTPPSNSKQELVVEIASEGQSMFSNVIPNGKTLQAVYIEGIHQTYAVDYNVVGNTIDWISTELVLIPDFRFVIILN